MGDEIFPEDAAAEENGDASRPGKRRGDAGEARDLAAGAATEAVLGFDPFDLGRAGDLVSSAFKGEDEQADAAEEPPAGKAGSAPRDTAFPNTGGVAGTLPTGRNPAAERLQKPSGKAPAAPGTSGASGGRRPFADQMSGARGSGAGGTGGGSKGQLAKEAAKRFKEDGKEGVKDLAKDAAKDKALQAAAAYAGVPPAAVEGLKRVANSDSRTGRMLRRTPLLGRLLTDSSTKKREEQRKESATGQAGGSGAGKGNAKKAALGCSPAIAFVVIILMLVMAVLSGELANASGQLEPEKKSDVKIGKYLPKGWYKVLKDASETTLGQPEYAAVPWTILAGIVAHQTDFGRYSPYDDADRDPGRNTPALPTGGTPGTDGADGAIVGATNGAGPGPVKGVSGPGGAETVGSGHPGPPAGNLSQQMGWYLWALRMHESNGNYKEPPNKFASAAGAYQYTTGTWNEYKGYHTANLAPPAIQDERAIHDTLRNWNKYHRWQQVTMAHFYPDWANSPNEWNAIPAGGPNDNPTGWGFIDDVMKRMQKAARQYPPSGDTGSGASPSPSTSPATGPAVPGVVTAVPAVARAKPTASPSSRSPSPGDSGSGADPSHSDSEPPDGNSYDGWNCPVKPLRPPIGGRDGQGVGPFLLTPKAAAEMSAVGADPQNPCQSAKYVARQLSAIAKKVHGSGSSPRWKPEGNDKDKENARKYWSLVIERSGVFMDKSWKPGEPCALPPEQPGKPRSVSFKIINIWHCQFVRTGELHLVTDVKIDDGDKVGYVTESDRSSAERQLIDEALQVSYAAGKWQTKDCKKDSKERQGIFPMTKEEASAGGAGDRCDAEQNIAAAAKLVLSGEAVEPATRAKDLGRYQPMAGGWQRLGIALGQDLRTFSTYGPRSTRDVGGACTKVVNSFLTAIGPKATEFAELTQSPRDKDLATWMARLNTVETTNKIADPDTQPACAKVAGSAAYNEGISQEAIGLANKASEEGNKPLAANLNGLAAYYGAKQETFKPAVPRPGTDSLVIPRLAPRALKEIRAPIDDDALTGWSNVGSTAGTGVPLPQRAVEYAWFFGGVISTFDSAGKLIGSLADGSGGVGDSGPGGPGQSQVGPDGCPVNTPANTMRDGAAKLGIQKLCADSVQNAATPAAAKAIKWELARLGWRYCMCPKRNIVGWADCSSFASRAYQEGAGMHLFKGNALTVTPFHQGAYPWRRLIPFSQIRAGDLMVVGGGGHIAMQLVHGYKVHTNTREDVSRVDRTYSPGAVLATVRMIPEKA